MNRIISTTLAAMVASLFTLATSHVAVAFPSRGGSCTDCHSEPGGSLTSSPNPLNVKTGSNGLMTFTVTSLGGSSDTSISVQGLENPDLAASIGAGGNAWTHRVNATYGMSYTSNTISSTGPYTLDLVIGSSAISGSYPIVVQYAGDGQRGSETGFDLVISPPGVSGDYNGNGVVDAADYVLWRNGGPLLNQVDDPSMINAADYTAWRARFGNTAGSGSFSVALVPVPEPTAAALTALGLLAMMAIQRRRD